MEDMIGDFRTYVAQTSPYSMELEVDRAQGPYIYAVGGKRYLDFTSGIGVSGLGHGNQKILNAASAQIEQYLHTNVYGEHIQGPQVELAKVISEHMRDPGYQVFFTNSGAEANELALKMSRKLSNNKRPYFVAVEGGFHGRTFGTMSVSHRAAYREGFGDLLPTQFIRPNDHSDLDNINWINVSACILELVQGEAGALPLSKSWVRAVYDRCRIWGVNLIFDEVQTGWGRTGTWLAQEHFGVIPNFTTIGKAIGGGFPLGGVIAKRECFEKLQTPPFSHVTTFGGHPVSCAAGLAFLDQVDLNNVKSTSFRLLRFLGPQKLFDVSGMGLLLALHFRDAEIAGQFVTSCHQRGLIVGYKLNNPKAVRIAPHLNLTEAVTDEAISIMRDVLEELA